MKKLFCFILAAIIFAAWLESCAGVTTPFAPDPKITLTSSDAADAAAWLCERLDSLPDKLVIGTDAHAYGIDLSALEDDGCIIRTLGDEVVLFARTANGLDRAARKYAKAVEAGESVLDITYHEGARVERLTVAGADISTFAVRVEGPGRDEDVTALRDRVESKIAVAVAPLVKKMCGAELSDAASAGHFIIFRPTRDASFTEGDFRYAVEDGDLVFEYAELLGAKNAVQTFLADECGWEGIAAGRDMLAEADEIAIPEELEVKVDTMLDGLLLPSRSFGTQYRNSAYADLPEYRGLYGVEYRIPHACNGWLTYRWGDFDVSYSTPCMTNVATLDSVVDSVIGYIDERTAAGAVVGYDLNYIDVAHGDTEYFCTCKKCTKVYIEETSRSGASVRFANSIAEALEDAGYSPIKVITYAYRGNYSPCKTRPRDDVYVTFCIHARCINHPVDATRCTEVTHPFDNVGPEHFAKWMKGWGELTDNLYLWDYFLDYNFHPYILIDQIWEDMHYMRDCRVTRTYWECHQCGIGTMELQCQLTLWLNCHPDATREEYDEKFRSLIELHYGDGWDKVWEAFDLWERAELEYDGCCLGWQFTSSMDPTQMNYAYYLNECQDKILSLLDEAITLADSADDVREIELVRACHLYLGCFGGYFYATETDDGEYMSLLEARYAEAFAVFAKYGVTVGSLGNENASFTLYSDLGEMARGNWDVTTAYIKKTAREVVVKQFTGYDGALTIPSEK